MIDQDTDISRQLTLWDQRGSRVIRGNLLAVPIEQNFLFVEPVFLIAEGAQIPQLQRVIVAYGERIEMAPSLEEAILRVFGAATTPVAVADTAVAAPATGSLADQRPARQLAQQALDRLDQAQQALQNGEWSEFGTQLQDLRDYLQESSESGGSEAEPATPAPEPDGQSPSTEPAAPVGSDGEPGPQGANPPR